MIIININEFRKILREKGKGYKLRTKTIQFQHGKPIIVSSIYKDKQFIVGKEANVYGKKHIEKHRKMFDLYKSIKKEGLYNKDKIRISM